MRVRQVLAVLFLLCGFQTIKTYGQVVATWTDSSGNWSSPANWSTNTVPNNGGGAFYNAVINGTGSDTITFDASGTVVNSLTIGTGETFQDNGLAPTLTIGDPSFPTPGTLTNSGTINWSNGAKLVLDITAGNDSCPEGLANPTGCLITNNGTMNFTNSTLTISDGGNRNTATLAGAGTLNLSGAFITGSSGDETLVNNSTIQGSGTISNLTLVNNGTINANGSAALIINNGLSNYGTINVTGSGGLVTGSVGDVGGMNINDSTLTVKGDFAQHGFSLVLQNGSVGSISGSLNTGVLEGNVFLDHSSLTVGSVFSGSGGTIAITNGSTLNVQGGVTETESEALTVSGGSSAIIGGDLSLGDTIGVTVDGSSLTVRGSYSGDYAGAMVQNGGSLTVGGNFINSSYGDPANLSLTGASSAIVSGDFNNAYEGGVALSGSTLTVNGDFTNSSQNPEGVLLQNGGVLTVGGTFTNEFTNEFAPSKLELLGQGNVASLYAVQNGGLIEVDAGSTLAVNGGGFSNNSGGTLNLAGVANVVGGFTNSGGSVIVSPTAVLKADTYSQSAGSTDVSGTLATHTFSQSSGSTTIESSGLLSATTFQVTGGTITVNGILDPTAVEIGSSAALQGTGTIIGNVAMAGTLTPGAPGTPGTLTIFGNYEQIESGDLEEFIGPLSRSFLNVNGNVALDSGSIMNIVLLQGFNPLGETFSIMDYNSLVGQFSNGSSFWEDGYLWDITYGQHGIDVTAVSTPEPSSLLLLFVGLAALALYVHRKMDTTQRLA